VTGTPRSGTTPVGDLLSAAAGAAGLYEPLNAHVGDRRVRRYFEVAGAAGFTEDDLAGLVAGVQDLDLSLRPGVFPGDRGLRRALKRVVGSQTRASYRRARLLRPDVVIWKDPFAALLAEPIRRITGSPVVVTVRPPAAVAASFKRLGWSFEVADLVERLGAAGEPYRSLLDAERLAHPAGNAAVLWHVVNGSLLDLARRDDGVMIVDTDVLIADREATVRRLYDRLGLPVTTAVEHRIARSGRGDGPAHPTGTRAHGGHRDPAAANTYWSDVLTPAEAADVADIDAELWEQLRAVAL
jgi:hypothetical protein